MIREITAQDKEIYLTLQKEFYHSPAVLHPIPDGYFLQTFEEVISGSPYAKAYLLLDEKENTAGYVQVSFTYSNEAGGIVAWVEEIYVRPAFQGKGIGAEFFRWLDKAYNGKIARVRLEVEAENEGAVRLYKRLGFTDWPYKQMVLEKNNKQ